MKQELNSGIKNESPGGGRVLVEHAAMGVKRFSIEYARRNS